MRARAIGLSAWFALLLMTGAAPAAEMRGAVPGQTVEYRIVHSTYDEIGSHALTFSQHGEDLLVDVATRVKVKFLFVTVHSETAARRETWRGGRFVGYSSHTDENGKLFDVVAHQEAGRLLIEGPEGHTKADGPVFPTNPWNPATVDATVMMDTKTGKLLKVAVAADGEETIDVAGKAVTASKFRVTGELQRELWYDAAGNLMQFRFVKDGGTVTFTRVTPLE